MPDRPAPLMIRGLDPDLWHQVRVEAVKRKQSMGALLNEIIRQWLARTARDGEPTYVK